MARFEYTVQRSSRRTYSIKVTEDNKIMVRAPARATQRDIENVVAEKRAWIERALAFNSANVLAGQRVKDYAEAYVRGERVPVKKVPATLSTDRAYTSPRPGASKLHT